MIWQAKRGNKLRDGRNRVYVRLRAIRGCQENMLHVHMIISGCVSNIWKLVPLLANWSTVTSR